MADDLYTYVRKNQHDVQERRHSREADDAGLKAQGFMRLDEVTGNAEDANTPTSAIPGGPKPKSVGRTSAPTTEETMQPHERFTE